MLSANIFNHVYDHSYDYESFYLICCWPLIGSKIHSALNQAEFVALKSLVHIKVSYDYSKLE